MRLKFCDLILPLAVVLTSACQTLERAREGLRTIEHRVPHVSTVPANDGEDVRIFVREKVASGASAAPRPVVLMVHGEIFPSAVAFDVDYSSYSWMAYLARAGFDVFAVDMTGYGRSARPKMDDPCNVTLEQQKMLIPKPLREPCQPSYGYQLVNRRSEHDELDRVVEYVRKLRGVSTVSLLGWSSGAYRAGTYASQHPEKIDKLVIFASSSYSRRNPSGPPAEIPQPGFPMTIQSREMAETKRWLPFAKCADQIETGVPERIWNLSKRHDTEGMKWGPGVMRAPTHTYWGWNAAEAKRIKVPTLVMIGEFDPLSPSNRELYEDLGAESKVFVSIACGSHFAVWEKSHTLLHEASRLWLSRGSFSGVTRGEFKMSLAK